MYTFGHRATDSIIQLIEYTAAALVQVIPFTAYDRKTSISRKPWTEFLFFLPSLKGAICGTYRVIATWWSFAVHLQFYTGDLIELRHNEIIPYALDGEGKLDRLEGLINALSRSIKDPRDKYVPRYLLQGIIEFLNDMLQILESTLFTVQQHISALDKAFSHMLSRSLSPTHLW